MMMMMMMMMMMKMMMMMIIIIIIIAIIIVIIIINHLAIFTMASASHFETGEWGNSEMTYLSPAIFYYLKCKKESVRFYVCTGYYVVVRAMKITTTNE